MESAAIARGIAGAAMAALPRFEPAPVQEAVPSQLPPSAAVTATATLDASRPKEQRAPLPAQGVAGATEEETSFDTDTGAVVLRVIDLSNGLVVRQQPAEALLKLRAYQRAAAESSQETFTEDRLA